MRRPRTRTRAASTTTLPSDSIGRDKQLEETIGKGFATGALLKMKWVRLDAHEPSETCILHRPDSCVSATEATGTS